jgi:hypothetical protein
MISEQLRLLVDYRFSEAKQTLEEARILGYILECISLIQEEAKL